MMIQPLNFYDSLSERMTARHRLNGHYSVPMIVVDQNQLVPFCLSRVRANANITEYYDKFPITEVNLINSRGVSQNIVSKMRFKIAATEVGDGTVEELILYAGNSENISLKQDIYYLHIKDNYTHQGYNANNWYSDDFRFSFQSKTVTFKFTANISGGKYLKDNKLWFYPYYIDQDKFYYILKLPVTTSMTPDFDSYVETTNDEDNFQQYGFQRFADIRRVITLGDANLKRLIKFIQMLSWMNDGEVILIDEVGNENQIVITDLPINPLIGNYADIEIKYMIKSEAIRSNNMGVANILFTQEAETTPELVLYEEILKSSGKTVKSHGKTIKRR